MAPALPLPSIPAGHDHLPVDADTLTEAFAQAVDEEFVVPPRVVDVEPAASILGAVSAGCTQCQDVLGEWIAEHGDPLLAVHLSTPVAFDAVQMTNALASVLPVTPAEHVRTVLEYCFGADVAAVVGCMAADLDLVAATEAFTALPVPRRREFLKAVLHAVANPPELPDEIRVTIIGE